MEVPFRFVIYFFIIGLLIATVINVAVYETRTYNCSIDMGFGRNVSIEEFIEEVQFAEAINNNFSIPRPIFDNMIGLDIIIDYGDYIEYSNRSYYVDNRVEGTSMLPIIYEGVTLMCIKDFTKEELQINSLIVFTRNNGFVSHRIVDIQNGSYITKGDNNPVTDGYVEYEDVHCLIGGIIY